MAITARAVSIPDDATPQEFGKILKGILQDFEDQLNERAQVYTSTNGKAPNGLQRGDILFIAYKGKITISVKNVKTFDLLTADMLGGLLSMSTSFKGLQTGTALPAIAQFPNPLDWGFFYKTSVTAAFYLCFNYNNILLKVALT